MEVKPWPAWPSVNGAGLGRPGLPSTAGVRLILPWLESLREISAVPRDVELLHGFSLILPVLTLGANGQESARLSIAVT